MRSRSTTLWILFLLGACGRSGLRVAGTGGSSGGDGTGEGSAGIGVAPAWRVSLTQVVSPKLAVSQTRVASLAMAAASTRRLTTTTAEPAEMSARPSRPPGLSVRLVAVLSRSPPGWRTSRHRGGRYQRLLDQLLRRHCDEGAFGRWHSHHACFRQTHPSSIAVDAISVYWTTDQYVLKVSLDGSSFTLLGSGEQVVGIAVDATSVYWASGGGGAVNRVPLGGGITTRSLPSPRLSEHRQRHQNIYWTDPADGTVMRVPLNGGTPPRSHPDSFYPRASLWMPQVSTGAPATM